MKIILSLFFFCVFSFMTFAHDQQLDVLLCSQEWMPLQPTYELNEAKAGMLTSFTHQHSLSDATSYLFKKDGTFEWNDHPSCGTNAFATSGQGTWTLGKNNTLLLDFKNIQTEQHGVRKLEKYVIIKLTDTELVLLKI